MRVETKAAICMEPAPFCRRSAAHRKGDETGYQGDRPDAGGAAVPSQPESCRWILEIVSASKAATTMPVSTNTRGTWEGCFQKPSCLFQGHAGLRFVLPKRSDQENDHDEIQCIGHDDTPHRRTRFGDIKTSDSTRTPQSFLRKETVRFFRSMRDRPSPPGHHASENEHQAMTQGVEADQGKREHGPRASDFQTRPSMGAMNANEQALG
jgi:hypothetical protein